MAELIGMKVTTDGGITMRKLFILTALVFALVTAVTATVVATTISSNTAIALANR
jgi:hypothetical protein